ncbi:MAG: peroxiredoxin family protein [Candidatus Thorarchaeota archaeon]|jgi:peroxiredoxin
MNESNSLDSSDPLRVGDCAPDFVLPTTDDVEMHLMDMLDNIVVLVFFSETLTLFSESQAEAFKRLHESLSNIGVTFFGIATEPISTLKTFIEDKQIPFLLASDFDRTVSKTYGVYASRITGGLTCVARPSIFVIDQASEIDYIWIGDEDNPLPHPDEIADHIIKSRTQE